MVEELKKNDDIVVLNNHLFPPASIGDFSAISDVLGKNLASDILALMPELKSFRRKFESQL